MNDLDFVPRPVQDVNISTNPEAIKPINKKRSYHAPLTVRNPTPDDVFNMIHSLADTPSREQVTRYTLVDNKPSAPMRKPTPFARTRSNTSSSAYVIQNTQDEEVMTNQGSVSDSDQPSPPSLNVKNRRYLFIYLLFFTSKYRDE
jgi:hypothetical protein